MRRARCTPSNPTELTTLRTTVGSALRSTLGKERTRAIRKRERRFRRKLARKIAPPKAAKVLPPEEPQVEILAPGLQVAEIPPESAAPPWQPSDPSAVFVSPRMSRHQLLGELHQLLAPRTYLEIGVNDGASLTLSGSTLIAIDPKFAISHPLSCDLALVQATSDEFFAGDDPCAHFEGVPIDLAFIDGMHLSEFALRDFMNTERYMSPAGVVVLDDMLPRNSLEASRDRLTLDWTGDVYKMVAALQDTRPDLVVIPVNTAPTGTLVVLGLDPASKTLSGSYEELLSGFLSADPQSVPAGLLQRTVAVSAEDLLNVPLWACFGRSTVQRRSHERLSPLSTRCPAKPWSGRRARPACVGFDVIIRFAEKEPS
ncbi:MAG: type 11 methyltransferase [Nocardioidaceae bacterium]|nr:type 11 methyltransferase [Nocardioidaceae bacterium]